MALYREHRGSLADSLATTITVSSLAEIEEHYKNDPYFHALTNYQCKNYGSDHRLQEWKSTYMVTAMSDGKRIPVGFANALLE